MQLSGEGTALDHRISMNVTGAAATPRDTPPSAEMQITGTYDQKVWNATVTTTKLVTGKADDKISIAEPAKIMASSDQAQLDNFCLIAGAGRICASGKWQKAGSWEGTVSGYEIPLALLLPPPPGEEAEYGGRIEGRVHAFGAPNQPWQGEAGMRIIDAAIIYRPQGAEPETLNLGTGGLAATAKPERIDFSFGVQAFTDTYLFANAHLDRNGTNDLLRLPLTGDMRARAADANILPLLFSEVDNAAGLLTANATIGGTLAEPEINGRVELANGELDSYRVNFALRNANLVADLASNGLNFRGTGRAGEGEMQADGRFTWSESKLRGELHLRGSNLLVADLPEYRVDRLAGPALRHRRQQGQCGRRCADSQRARTTQPNLRRRPSLRRRSLRSRDRIGTSRPHDRAQRSQSHDRRRRARRRVRPARPTHRRRRHDSAHRRDSHRSRRAERHRRTVTKRTARSWRSAKASCCSKRHRSTIRAWISKPAARSKP